MIIKHEEVIKAVEILNKTIHLAMATILKFTRYLENKVGFMFEEQYRCDKTENLIMYYGMLCKSVLKRDQKDFENALQTIRFNRNILAKVVEEFLKKLAEYDKLVKCLSKAPTDHEILSKMERIESEVGGTRSTLYGCYRNCKAYYEKYRKTRENLIITMTEAAKNISRKYRSDRRGDVFQNLALGVIEVVDRLKVDLMYREGSVIKFLKNHLKGFLRRPPYSTEVDIPLTLPPKASVSIDDNVEDIAIEENGFKKIYRENSPILTKGEKFIVGLMFLDPVVGKPPTEEDIEKEIKRQAKYY